MKKALYLLALLISFSIVVESCAPRMSSVDKRKKQLAKKKRKDPNDCPKIDCD